MHSNQCNNMIFYSALNERLTRSQSNPTRRAPGAPAGGASDLERIMKGAINGYCSN